MTAPTVDAAAQAEVQLTVTSSAIQGQPRTYALVAELTGGADNDPRLYCQSTTWEFGDGPGLTVTPSCAPYTPDVRIQRHFQTTHFYDAPGRYTVTFRYGSLSAQHALQVR
jgi:hypothetical protein